MNSTTLLREAIVKHGDLPEIKQLLLSLSRSEILKEDNEHLDILHYAVQSNYAEAVHLLFLKGFFVEPHQPSCVPYLHLACKLGHAAIVSILLKERPHDIDRTANFRCQNSTSDIGYRQESETDIKPNIQNVTALDLAADGGHIKCVRLLLNSFDRNIPRSPGGRERSRSDKQLSLLERAVEKCSTKAVQLLLTSEDVRQDDIDSAFKVALHRKLTDCVDILLKNGHAQVGRILNGMNPYHVLYMYSSAYQVNRERNCGLDSTTSVLISHNFDVNDFSKCGSFPLYSLLNSMIEEKDFFPMEMPTYHLKAMKFLLSAGADPNFDEVVHSSLREPNSHTLGRPLYTSALNALFGSLQSTDNWYAMFPEFVTHCCGLLLRNGCNPRRVDGRGRTVLHDLMKCLAMEHTMGNMSVNILPIVQILMRYGADPNIDSLSELFPVSSYYQTLFNLMDGRLAIDNWKSSRSHAQVLQLLRYMKHRTASQSCQQIVRICQNAETNSTAGISVVSHVTPMLQQYTNQHSCLQDLCRLQIWESIDRQRDRLSLLPLPTSLQKSVLNYFC